MFAISLHFLYGTPFYKFARFFFAIVLDHPTCVSFSILVLFQYQLLTPLFRIYPYFFDKFCSLKQSSFNNLPPVASLVEFTFLFGSMISVTVFFW